MLADDVLDPVLVQQSRADKGKGKAIEVDEDSEPTSREDELEGIRKALDDDEIGIEFEEDGDGGDEEDGNEDGEDGGNVGRSKKFKKGPVSSEMKAEIQALGDEFRAKIDHFAALLGKPRSVINRIAGFELRPSRAPNMFNDFQAWYAIKFRDENVDCVYRFSRCLRCFADNVVILVSSKERQEKMLAAWKDLMRGVAKDDREEKALRMKSAYEDLEKFKLDMKDSDDVKKYASTRVRGAIQQLNELVSTSLRPFSF